MIDSVRRPLVAFDTGSFVARLRQRVGLGVPGGVGQRAGLGVPGGVGQRAGLGLPGGVGQQAGLGVPGGVGQRAGLGVPGGVGRRGRFATLVVGAGLLLTACGGGDDKPLPLTSLVIGAETVPAGFTVVPAEVEDLIAGNRSTLEQAASVTFTPPECRPTADAGFNPQLNPDNTVLLVAQSDTAMLSEVVSSVTRDVDADRRATTGPCAVVTATPTTGSLAGARIVTTSTELPKPTGPEVQQALVIRSDSITTLAGGQVRVRSALLSNVLVRRPSGEIVTVQLNVGSTDGRVLPAAPATVTPPMGEDEFGKLVQAAAARAAR